MLNPATSPRVLPATQRGRRGFTLLELVMSIALGMVLIFTVYTAFRLSAQTVITANRLSTENSLLRAGYFCAQNDLDFWTNYDDPLDPNHEGLRTVPNTPGIDLSNAAWAVEYQGQSFKPTTGLPFSAMADVFPPNINPADGSNNVGNGSKVPRYSTTSGPVIISAPSSSAGAIDPDDNDTGYDPTYTWAPHDPRTWFRGNLNEQWCQTTPDPGTPDMWFGRYGIFTNSDANPTYYTTPQGLNNGNGGSYNATYVLPSDGAAAIHHWHDRQLLGLTRAIGFYRLCDYLPASVQYGMYTSYVQNHTTHGGLASFFGFESAGQYFAEYPFSNLASPTLPWGPGFFTFCGTGMGSTSIGLYAQTIGNSFGVIYPGPNPVDGAGITDPTTIAWRNCSYYGTDYPAAYGDGATDLQDFLAVGLPLSTVMPSGPSNWPTVLVGTAHYIKCADFVNIARIRWTSALTGTTAEISFVGLASSLRGARMQRKPGIAAGWAKWDNAANAVNDINLDGVQ